MKGNKVSGKVIITRIGKIFEDKVFLKNLMFLTVPIVLQEMLNSSVNMMDTFMIGRLGENEVTAVGLANQIFFLFTLILFGISSGSSVLMGQYWGKKDGKSIRSVLLIAVIISMTAAFVFFCGAFFIPGKIMAIYSKDERVIELGIEYLKIVPYSYIIYALIIPINFALKATNNTKYPMITTFISLISNIVCNYIFIFILGYGVKGAALGTVTARSIEFAVQIGLIWINKTEVFVQIKDYHLPDRKFAANYFNITVPVICNEFIWALGTSIYNIAYKYSDTQAQAAVQISGTIQNLFIVLGVGIASGCGIMIANALGAGNSERAIEYSRKSIIISEMASLIVTVIMIFIAPYIIELFDVSNYVKELSVKALIVISIGLSIKNFNYTTIVGILRNGGDTKFCLIADTAGVWLIGIPMAFLGSYFLRLPIYYTLAMVYTEELFKCVISGIRVKNNKWAKSIID